MKIAAIIPARYESSRFPGKPLVRIKGVTMIERVYRRVEQVGKFAGVLVATDDQRIEAEVRRFGGQVVMTSPHHDSGTCRLWEVMEKRENDFDAAVNIQGDEPLIPVQLVSDLYDHLQDGGCDVVTAAYYNRSADNFLSHHVVKVVFGKDFRALYFSRSPIPFLRDGSFQGFYQHIGIYGYHREALRKFVHFQPSPLEVSEKLEQLRFLENGLTIRVILSDEKSCGVDVPEDIQKIEEILAFKGIENE